MADCIMEVTEALIGNVISAQTRQSLGDIPMSFGAEQGYQIGGRDKRMDNFYDSKKGTHTFREQKASEKR